MTGAAAQVTLEQAMQLAVQYFQAGRLMLADRTLNDILKSVPDYPDALHLLGVVYHARGNLEKAIKLTGQAAAAEQDNVLFNCNFGVMLSEAGRKEEALAAYDRAIKANEEYADSYSNKANTLWELGRYKEAEQAAYKALTIKPDYPDALLNLGNALQSQNMLDEAIAKWLKAVELNPRFDKGWTNLGNAARDQGRLKDAVEYCRKAVELNENNPHAWNNLANSLRDLGQAEEAEAAYRRATALTPNYAEAHNNLSICLMDQGRLKEALEAVRYALAFKPDMANAQSNLSIILREMGDLEGAELAAQKVITLLPEKASGYLDLAGILFLSDRFDEAEVALDKAKALEPDSPRVYLKLSGVLERLNRVEEALQALEEAQKLSDEFPELHYRKGHIYYMAGLMDKARAEIDKALDMAPEFVAAYGTLAEILQSINDMKESEQVIRKALEINNTAPFMYLSLGKLKKYSMEDPDFIRLLEIEKNEDNMGKLNQACLHFALFKAWQDIGDYQKAFEHLKKGNDRKRETIPYDPDQNATFHRRIIETYSAETMQASFDKPTGHKDQAPVFIVGMPRSGTTLTEQIISSHPDVFPAGELTVFPQVAQPSVTAENAALTGKAYINRVYELFPQAKKHKFFTDKMPGNYLRMAEILLALPEAKIIHCRRNPVDTSLSCYKQLFARGQYWSYNLEELARQYNNYLEVVAHWRQIFPDRFLEVDYEDTVSDLESQARRMIEYIGLPWNDACLSPHKQQRTVMTASKTQVTKPVYQSSVEAWKRYETQLQPLVNGINFDRVKA